MARWTLAVATLIGFLAFATPALASSVTNVSFSNTDPSGAAGALTVQAVSFKTSTPVGRLSAADNSKIRITVPAGTTDLHWAGGAVHDVVADRDVASCARPVNLVSECSLPTNGVINAGTALQARLKGLTNPQASGTASVSTTADTD